MKTKTIHSLLFSILFLAASCATTPQYYTPETYRETFNKSRSPANFQDCFQAITDFFVPQKPKPKPIATTINSVITPQLAQSAVRFPKGFEGLEEKQIQYGFESEYLHEETEAFFLNYMPASSLYNGTKEDWLALTHAQRLHWIDNNSKSLFPYREKGKLVKISTDPELQAALPESFVYDAGHFEIVLDPMDSAEELIKKIQVINKHFGVGSMQVTISNPLDKAKLASKEYKAELRSQVLGYYNFMNDFDTISKLGAGYERYLKDPSVETVKSFNHPWLGPMTKLKHDRLEDLVDGVVNQKNFSEEELKQMSYLVVSHKFIGGLSFRPDVAYKKGRIASEVRDCHQNLKCIEDRIIRETYFLMKGKEAFSSFSKLVPFDSLKSFKTLSNDTQSMLKQIFPTYGNFNQKELELFRNFSYPLRDWSKHIETLNAPELKTLVETAQNEYVQTLEQIAKDFDANKISTQEAKVKIMGALGSFSKQSGLLDAMKKQFGNLVDPEEIKNFNKLKFTIFMRLHFPNRAANLPA